MTMLKNALENHEKLLQAGRVLANDRDYALAVPQTGIWFLCAALVANAILAVAVAVARDE